MRLLQIVGALLFAVLVVGGCEKSPAAPDPVPIPDPTQNPDPSSSQADLVISQINFSPGSPGAGEEITFSVFVRNRGDAPAAASMLRFQVGGESDPPETAVPALGSGEEYRHERKVTLDVAQNYRATATADSRGHVAESNEGNNVRTKDFTVQSAPPPTGQFDVSPNSRDVSSASGTTSFSVSSTVGWSVEDDVVWLAATKTDGSTISVIYDANTSTSSRTANIRAYGTGGVEETVTVTQAGS